MATTATSSPSWLAQFGGGSKIASMQASTRQVPNGPMPEFQLPEWLSTDPNKLVGELMSEYSGTGKRFDPTGIANAYNTSINTAMGMGGQIADNAAREAMARAGQEGGGTNSAMVKAQSMLPVYEHTAGLRKDKALAVADVRAREGQMRASLAQAIGSMRTSYLSMLGDMYLRGQGMTNQWAQGNRQYALQQDEFDLRRDLATLQERNARSGGNGSGLPMFQGQITRAPNNFGIGGVEYTPQFREYLEAGGAPGINPNVAPPRYPGVGTSGGRLDEYNKQWRDIFSAINGQPSYNQTDTDSAYAQNMAGGYAAPDATAMQRLLDSLKTKNLTL